MTANRDRRPLAGFLGAVGVSTLGTRMSMLGLPRLVLTTTGSPALTGVVAFAEMAPYVTVQAIGGPMVDRLGARRISVGTDLLAAAFLGLVPVLFAARLLPSPALAGLVAVTWAGPRLPRRMTYAVGFLLGGAPRYLALAATGSVPLVLAVAGVSEVGLGGINPVVGAAEYERVPRHLQARALGAVGASAWAGIPLGSLAGGVAVSAFGLRPAPLAAGVLYVVVTLAPFTFPVWRQLDRRPSPPPGDAVTIPGPPTGRAATDRA